MNFLIRLFFLFFVIILCVPLNAQENSVDQRIANVENIVSKLPNILGDINLRHRYDDAGATTINSFDVRRARLDFRGNISKPVSYRLHIDFANSPKILDVLVNWKINDYMSLQAGQYKIPFSLENPYNPNNLEMIDNSLAITHLVNYSDVSGISANGRDIGIGIIGRFFQKEGYSLINYSLGIFNGSGINTADTNEAKDFSGIVSFNPSKNLTLAVSHYNGKTDVGDNSVVRLRNGIGAKYENNRLLLRSELIQGTTGNLKSQGAYAVLGYYVHEKVQALTRYDYFNRNLMYSTWQRNYTVGLNYLPVNNLRLQLNYTYRTTRENNSNYIVTQLWVKF